MVRVATVVADIGAVEALELVATVALDIGAVVVISIVFICVNPGGAGGES